MQAKKEITQHAQAAKMIRGYLKEMGIKGSVTSSSFSMGNSVDVDVQDLDPATRKALEDRCEPHEYGTFDGMTDSTGFKNQGLNIPQAKYVHVTCSYSDEVRQAAWDVIREYCAKHTEFTDLPVDVNDAFRARIWHNDGQTELNQFLNGSTSWLKAESAAFWAARKPKADVITLPTGAQVVGTHIEEHVHTKHGFTMHMVILGAKVTKGQFTTFLDLAKAMGGWYSKAWGTTPGGFAFKEAELAQAFMANIGALAANDSGEPSPTPPKAPAPAKLPNLAEKFRGLAEGLQAKIIHAFGDRLTNTPKRMREAQSARNEGMRLERTQKALLALATLHEAGTVPQELAGIRSKADVYERMRSKMRESTGYYDAGVDLGQPPEGADATTLALWSLLSDRTPEQKVAEELKQKLDKLKFTSIPGYFPTPPAIVQDMIDRAQLRAGMTILEPSAGSGAIACAVEDYMEGEVTVVVMERNYSLCEVLRLRGFNAEPVDFMEQQPGTFGFDRVIMNPPFEKQQDIDHVLHAFKFLKPGGRLVAIMSPSFQYHSGSKAEAFRAWIEQSGGEVTAIPAGAFKESGTDVATVMVVVDKEEA